MKIRPAKTRRLEIRLTEQLESELLQVCDDQQFSITTFMTNAIRTAYKKLECERQALQQKSCPTGELDQ